MAKKYQWDKFRSMAGASPDLGMYVGSAKELNFLPTDKFDLEGVPGQRWPVRMRLIDQTPTHWMFGPQKLREGGLVYVRIDYDG